MTLTIQMDLPAELEAELAAKGDIATDVKEAFALELFRQGRLSHQGLSRVLGLDRIETSAYLKRHNVFEGSLTMEELEADGRTLHGFFAKAQ
jgi:predicted HTH domain antitoxin